MKRIIVLLIGMMFVFIGCAHGPMNGYPPSYDNDNYSKIVLKRPSKFCGGGMSIQIILDGEIIYAMANGENISFNITSRKHKIGVIGASPWTNQVRLHQIEMEFKPGKSYCFVPQIHLNIAPTIEMCQTYFNE